MKIKYLYWFAGLLIALLLIFGTEPEQKNTTVSYAAYNDTDIGIVAIAINGKGGVLGAAPHQGGGEVCCVAIPKKWTPGLKAKIQWEEDGDWLRDEKGNVIFDQARGHIYIPKPWREREVEIPRYGEELGTFQIYFLPQDDIKVAVFDGNYYEPSHPFHRFAPPK